MPDQHHTNSHNYFVSYKKTFHQVSMNEPTIAL